MGMLFVSCGCNATVLPDFLGLRVGMFFKVILVFGSFIVSLLLVALILKVSRRMGWYDRTGGRKIHSGNIPRLGGLGFTVSFIIFVIIGFSRTGFGFTFQVLPVAAGFVLILISGILDDFNPLTPRCKLIFQAVAALCVLLSGRIFTRFVYDDVIRIPGREGFWYFLTAVWVIGMTNAVNFIDGVDGLAGGISLLAVLSFGVISPGGEGGVLLLCACLASAVLGFLMFNAPFPRAKIFMGDGGAYFLGFMLALLPLRGGGGGGGREFKPPRV
jgi:UDP-GlcNAc:undecaprenyl-phosphate GlcNAc-1-phosphate transferase